MKPQITNPDAVKGKVLQQVGCVALGDLYLALVFEDGVAFYTTSEYLISSPLDYSPQGDNVTEEHQAFDLVTFGVWTVHDLDVWNSHMSKFSKLKPEKRKRRKDIPF